MRCSASGAGREVRARLWGGALARGAVPKGGDGAQQGPRAKSGTRGGGGLWGRVEHRLVN